MNKAYIESFPRGMALPARTCIGGEHLRACSIARDRSDFALYAVAALPKGTDVEITCVSEVVLSRTARN